MQQLGQGLLQRLVQRQHNGYQGGSIACNGGGSMRFVGHRSRDIHSIFGWIKIRRAYYHCPGCHSGYIPYDQASGLGCEQLSPGLARYCCTLAVDDSFEHPIFLNFLKRLSIWPIMRGVFCLLAKNAWAWRHFRDIATMYKAKHR